MYFVKSIYQESGVVCIKNEYWTLWWRERTSGYATLERWGTLMSPITRLTSELAWWIVYHEVLALCNNKNICQR